MQVQLKVGMVSRHDAGLPLLAGIHRRRATIPWMPTDQILSLLLAERDKLSPSHRSSSRTDEASGPSSKESAGRCSFHRRFRTQEAPAQVLSRTKKSRFRANAPKMGCETEGRGESHSQAQSEKEDQGSVALPVGLHLLVHGIVVIKQSA